jgi:hypothetical protein
MTTWILPSEMTSDFNVVLLLASVLSITVLLVTLYIEEIEGCALRLVHRLRAAVPKPREKSEEHG